MKRDVDAFKVLLWRWFEAENDSYAFREGNTPDWEAEGTKEAEAAASQALAAVLAAFQAEPDDASLKAAFRQSLETGNLHPDLDNPLVGMLSIFCEYLLISRRRCRHHYHRRTVATATSHNL